MTPPTGVVLDVITTIHIRYEELAPIDFEKVEIRPGPTIAVHIVQ